MRILHILYCIRNYIIIFKLNSNLSSFNLKYLYLIPIMFKKSKIKIIKLINK